MVRLLLLRLLIILILEIVWLFLLAVFLVMMNGYLIQHVHFIPGMSRNLISLSTLDAEGFHYSGSGGVLKVSKGSLICLKGDMNSAKLYVLRGSTLHGSVSTAAAVTNDELSKTNLWHMRLGHMSKLGMAELMKRNLLDGCTSSNMKFCEHCIFGKHKRVKFNTSVHTTKGTLDYVHADLWGPSRKLSLGGARYMLTIIDDYSRKVWPYFLKNKDDTFDAFKNWKVMIERQTERKVKLLRTDNGGEFCSDVFNDYCRQEGIVRHHTIPHTPQQNGVAERMNRTIISKARCMLSNARMSKRFWAEAANTACYLINRSPSIPLNKKTPIEVWSSSPADYSQLRVFGCTAYAHVDNGKLEPRAIKCLFLGYGSGVKGYKLWNPETGKTFMSRSVVFNESVMFNDSLSSDHVPDNSEKELRHMSVQVEHVDDEVATQLEPVDDHDNEVADDDVQHSPPVLQLEEELPIAHRRSKRSCGPPARLIEECNLTSYTLSCAEQVENTHEPATYTEAISCDDREKWISAMHEEMQSLEKNCTWEVVPLPEKKKIVRCKWIFKRKEGLSPSEPPKFKVRLVAKGYSQIPGVDYNDIFSPVVKHSSVRTFFSIVASHDFELEQLDVKTAFLHGELEEDIYMDQPEGFIVSGKEKFVCKLKRSLYGLK
ncbi:retrotransposon protein, putative, Ty1-copia subclass [Panicum miliaceum]|uniref:Retrotransposon protein, putative, Ty1-copia subclass n=1 Tax=Panicum miliaceum TaxID=4540 RepID=A0A3L6PQQ4_PANMI|nr:retrotransposon protein, putative, Ty1-copia subclass [Panicum miliaceum]